MRPFPDQTSGSLNQALTINDVNSDAYRQQIIANCKIYQIPSIIKNSDQIYGTGESGTQQNIPGTLSNGMPTENMFTSSKEEDKPYAVFPEGESRTNPVYAAAPFFET